MTEPKVFPQVTVNIQLQLVAGNATPEQIAAAVARIKALVDEFNVEYSTPPDERS